MSELSWDILTWSDVYAGVLESLATLCTQVHVPNVSIWTGEPLALAHVDPLHLQLVPALFLTLFQPLLSCPCHHVSVCHIVPPAGKSGSFGAAGHVLTHFCMYPAVIVSTPMLCKCLHVFGMPAASGLDFVICRPSLRFDSGLTSMLGDFMAFRHVLMYSITSPVISVLFQMPGMSLCPLDTSDPRSSIQVPPCLASPAFNFMAAPSPSPLATILLVFNTVDLEASMDLFVWHLPGNLTYSHNSCASSGQLVVSCVVVYCECIELLQIWYWVRHYMGTVRPAWCQPVRTTKPIMSIPIITTMEKLRDQQQPVDSIWPACPSLTQLNKLTMSIPTIIELWWSYNMYDHYGHYGKILGLLMSGLSRMKTFWRLAPYQRLIMKMRLRAV